jgi:hypothetical protein
MYSLSFVRYDGINVVLLSLESLHLEQSVFRMPTVALRCKPRRCNNTVWLNADEISQTCVLGCVKQACKATIRVCG